MAERQRSFRTDDRRTAAREHHTDGGYHQARRCANSRSYAAVHARADCRAGCGSGADSKGITSVGSVASPVDQFRLHLNLSAVGELDPGEFQFQVRNARHPSSLLRIRNDAGHGRAPARDEQSIGDDRFQQRAGERIAGLVVIARQRLIQANRHPGAWRAA